MPLVTTVVIAAAFAAALYLLYRWARGLQNRLRAASARYDEFYRHAQKLIQDERTPAGVLRFVQFYAAEAGRPRLARIFLRDFLLGKPAPPEPEREFEQNVADLPSELREHFTKMVACGYIAGALSDPFLAKIHWQVFPLLMSTSGRKDSPPSPERAASVAADFSSRHHAVAA